MQKSPEQFLYTPEDVTFYSETEGYRNSALVFPGQGIQEVGMGKDLFEKYSDVRKLYLKAEGILGYSLLDLTEENLTKTSYVQPAIFVYNEARRIAFMKENKHVRPKVYAGNSLGEFNAFLAAGAYSFEDGLRLVAARGVAMQFACNQNKGGLYAATLRADLDPAVAERQKEQFGALKARFTNNNLGYFLEADNDDYQFVFAGLEKNLTSAQEFYKTKIFANMGIRLIRLTVAGPFHSPYMEPARWYLSQMLSQTKIHDLKIPVIANTTGKLLRTREEVAQEIDDHLTMPVLWKQTIDQLEEEGIAATLELGEKNILTRMMQHRGKIAAVSVVAGGVAATILLLQRRHGESKKR